MPTQEEDEGQASARRLFLNSVTISGDIDSLVASSQKRLTCSVSIHRRASEQESKQVRTISMGIPDSIPACCQVEPVAKELEGCAC